MSKCNPPYNNANYKAPRMQFAIDSQLDKAQKKPYLDVELQEMLKDGETLAYHGSDASNIKEFELGRSSKNTSMLPQGIYTTSDERESADFGGTVYPVGVTQGNVFDMTNSSSNKITPAMVDAYREALFNAGYRGDWAEGLVSDFKKTGEMKIGISPSDKSKVYIAGGYDTLKDGSHHLISLNPNAARILGSTDSESVRDKFAKRDIRKADRVEERKRKKQWYNKPGILKPFNLSDLTT